MPNTYVNKVVYGSNTLIDLTSDTATAADVINSKYFHLKSGQRVQGTCTYDADTSDATIDASEVLSGEVAYANGNRIVGTMPNRGAVTGTISTKAGTYTIPQGCHDGSGSVGISSTEQAKIIASNIKSGITILGVTGSYSGESISAQTKSVTPATTSQTVLPDTGYDYLSQVNVAAIPYVETDNSAGGKTVTIAGS